MRTKLAMIVTSAIVISAVAALSFAAPANAATVVFTDNFNSYGQQLGWNGSGVWRTSSVDLVTSGNFNLTCAGDSGRCVDLTGSGAVGSISKILTLAAGTYSLGFDYTGNQLDRFGGPRRQSGFTASIGSLNAHIGPLANNSTVFTNFNSRFTTTGGPVTLTFAQDTGGDLFRGSILDNVSISAVPEPTTWGMMILGFGMMGAALRRARRRSAFA